MGSPWEGGLADLPEVSEGPFVTLVNLTRSRVCPGSSWNHRPVFVSKLKYYILSFSVKINCHKNRNLKAYVIGPFPCKEQADRGRQTLIRMLVPWCSAQILAQLLSTAELAQEAKS